jgi:catalase
VYVPGGAASTEALAKNPTVLNFINEAFMHCKPIAASGEGIELLSQAHLKGMNFGQANDVQNQMGVLTAQSGNASRDLANEFVEAIKQHRFWMRAHQK